MNDFDTAKKWLSSADAILITASNGLSIAEGYHIFADNDDFKKYFGKFREKYGITSLIQGVFASMSEADHQEYMRIVHQYLIDDYHGSDVMKTLLNIVSAHPYFILTSNADTHFQINGFASNQIFEVEGNFDRLAMRSPEWSGQQQRFTDFIQSFGQKKMVLLELGIGSGNQLIKAPTMQLAGAHDNWRYITMNMPQEINTQGVPEARTIALAGDIKENLNHLDD